MHNSIKFLYKKFLSIYYYYEYYYKLKWLKSLDNISSKINSSNFNHKKKLKILFGPSFSIQEPSIALDRVIATKLECMGCEVVPMYCDGIQDTECNVWGGDWKGDQSFNALCIKCELSSQKMWKSHKSSLVKLSEFIDLKKRKREIEKSLDHLNLELLVNFTDDGINYGQLAKDILVNNQLVASVKLVPKADSLMKSHIKNLILLKESYSEVIKQLRPDRVISNDSYYGMWKVLEIMCIKNSIPFYSQYPITLDRMVIKHNASAVDFDFKDSWQEFSKKPITQFEDEQIDSWLEGNRGLFLESTKSYKNLLRDSAVSRIDKGKPTILIAANVIWDLTALNKQIIFSDMINWITETIEWFNSKNEFQLIIKPHPIEISKTIPNTNETVNSGIYSLFKTLPPNVHLLKPDTHISSNEIIKTFDIRGVAVHSTTVGFEYPIYGIPSITTAKSAYRELGFTIDPVNKSQYFEKMQYLLSGKKKIVSPSEILLAKKFLKFYRFHYFSKLNIFQGLPVEFVHDFENKILNGDGPLDYICKKIIDGKPINDHSSWLPYSP
jgi:hypothetical protein